MPDPIRAALDKAAEALWQAESLRAAGRIRLTEWHDEGKDTRQKWRFMAAHGNAAFLRALPMILDRELHCRPDAGEEPYPDFCAVADAVLAAAKDQAND
jgi:hypothetical protein